MSKPLRVLMVEDSEDDALLTIRALTKGGYEPEYSRVETAEAMRNALWEKTWDVLLCDYRLPQFSGFAAIALLKDTGIDLPLIIVSSTIGEETAADCMRYGARDWVRKSNLSRLVPAIERELQEAQSRSKRQQAEKALRESEERYNALFDRSLDLVYITDFEGRFIDANDAALNRLGYAREEIYTLNFASLLSDDQLPLAFKTVQEIRETGIHKSPVEFSLRHKDGTRVFVETQGSAVTSNGARVAILAIARDITERKQAEDALRKSEEKYRSLLDLASDAIFLADMEGNLLEINKKAEDLLGYSKEEALSINISRIHPAEVFGKIKDSYNEIITKGSGYIDDVSILRKDGKIIPVDITGSLIEWGETKVAQGIFRDVTERKQAEEALRQAEENFRRSLDESPLGIGIVSEEGELLYANRMILDFFGYESVEELREKPFTKSYTALSYAEFLDRKKKRHLHADDSSDYEIDIVRKDGEIRHLQVWRKKIFWNSKKHYQAIYLDTTESKTVEKALRRSEENFRRSLDESPLGVRIVTAAGETIYANRAILDIYGFDSLDELKAVPPMKRYTPESYAEFHVRREKRREGIDIPSEYTIDIIRKNGEVRHLQIFRKEILWDGERQFQVIYQDITSRKKAEEALRESKEDIQGLFKNMINAFAIFEPVFDDDGNFVSYRFIYINEAYERITGVKNEEVKRKTIHEVWPETEPEWIKRYGEVAVTGASQTFELYHAPTKKLYHCNVYRPSDMKDRFCVVFEDITERKRAEEKLKTSRLHLQALYTRLQQVREEERLMVAREIHDEMGGGLTGLKMDLSWMLRKLGKAEQREACSACEDKIASANALIDQMIREVRRISSALRPSVLDDLGLIAALEWQLTEFTGRTAIPHEFATTCEYVNLEEDTAVAVFRIFQEALTNVVRHSGATKVVVDLREGERSLFGDESFVLEIRDNGKGITQEEILHPESLGLLGMKERVLAFGGELSIHGEPGGGTALILHIPRKQGETS